VGGTRRWNVAGPNAGWNERGVSRSARHSAVRRWRGRQTLVADRFVLTARGAFARQHHRHLFGTARERDRHDTAFGEVAIRGRAGRHDVGRTDGPVSYTLTLFASRIDDPVSVERENAYILRNLSQATTNVGLEANPYATVSEPYVVVGLLAERRLGRFRLFVNGENLTSVRQSRWEPLLRSSRGSDGRWTVDAWAPLEGRTINRGLRVGF